MINKHIVIITNLYPNRYEESKGLFIRQFSDRLSKKINVTVINPVPWIPKWIHQNFRKGIILPAVEVVDGIRVYHPRYLVIPKILRFTYGWFFFLGINGILKKIHDKTVIDLISAHWVYPDGYGSVIAANRLRIPVTVHARGCDINEYTKYFLRRRLIQSALKNSTLNISVSSEIKDKITNLGIQKEKTKVFLNGVDQIKFKPLDKNQSREKIGLDLKKKYILYVGNFQTEKGLRYLLDAVTKVRSLDFKLILVGSGPLQKQIEKYIKDLNISEKITLAGRLSHEDIPNYLSACDLLCLPSLREGCPNIILESLSAGTPVLSSDVGAVSDIVTRSEWGILVPPGDSNALAKGIKNGINLKEQSFPAFSWYDWDEYTELILSEFMQIIGNRRAPDELGSTRKSAIIH